MKYDLRINNIFWRVVEGYDIENALITFGIDADFTETFPGSGHINMDRDDIRGMIESDTDKDIEELRDEIYSAETITLTFGPAE